VGEWGGGRKGSDQREVDGMSVGRWVDRSVAKQMTEGEVSGG